MSTNQTWAYRDENDVPTLIAVSNVDGQTPVRLYADPVTHRLLVDATGGGTSITLQTNGTPNGSQTLLNLVSGTGITLTDNGSGSVTITSTGGGSSPGYQQKTSGAVDGSNTTFTWATAPNSIVVDQGRTMQKISSDGTVNWTGTITTTLTIPPMFDIFAIA